MNKKSLKKQLRKLKSFEKELPLLIDCSDVYGDMYYTEEDLHSVRERIKEVEKLIEQKEQKNGKKD